MSEHRIVVERRGKWTVTTEAHDFTTEEFRAAAERLKEAEARDGAEAFIDMNTTIRSSTKEDK